MSVFFSPYYPTLKAFTDSLVKYEFEKAMFYKYIQSMLPINNTTQKGEYIGAPFSMPESINFKLPNLLFPQLLAPINQFNLQNVIGCVEPKFINEEPISPFYSNSKEYSTEFKLDGFLSAQSTQGYVKRHKKKASKKVTDCPHQNEPHYAKNMCNNCYHSKGRSKRAWKCLHKEKAHYAHGFCQSCYQIIYIKVKEN